MNPENFPTPPSSESGSSNMTTASQGDEGHIAVAPYLRYLPPGKREKLAKAEFDMLMAEKELKVLELDKERTKYTTPVRKVYTVPFYLNEKQLKFATTRYPRTLFRVGQDTGHDHPLAHLETMIGTDLIARKFAAGRVVLDLFGSPRRCAALNERQQRSNNPKEFFPLVCRMSEKDHIRALDWPDYPHQEFAPEDWDQFFNDPEWYSPAEGHRLIDLMAINTLYYMTDEQIAVMLKRPRTRMLALVHRHNGQSGEMFEGEMSFAKANGMLEQVNAETGERYTHRDLSWLFDSTTKVKYTDTGAFTWTLHKQSPETWMVEIVGVPDTMNERFVKRVKDIGRLRAVDELNDHALVPTPFVHRITTLIPSTKVVMVGAVPLVEVDGGEVKVRMTSPELVEFLAIHMAGKPRDSVRLQDCFSLAVTHVSDGTDFPGKRNFKVAAADLPGHVMLGYLAAFSAELRVFRSLPTFASFFKEHKAHLEFRSYNTDLAGDGGVILGGMLSTINEARKKGDVFSGVLDAFNM